MIRNTRCAYCGSEMNDIENDKKGRSVEHMIPNVASIKKRKNKDGDFYACRDCNLKKGKTDELLGILTRLAIEDGNAEFDTKKFKDRIENRDKRFLKAAESLKQSDKGVSITIPLNTKESIDYFEYFGKGQYLICTGKVFDPKKFIIIVDVLGYDTLKTIEREYEKNNKSKALDDLSNNPQIYNLYNESFIISSDDAKDMFLILNRSMLIQINILPKNRTNITLRNKTKRRLYSFWSK